MKVIESFDLAWKRTQRGLFQPFRVGYWFALGFSAWLASFVTGGTGVNMPSTGNWNPKGETKDWFHLPEPFAHWDADTWLLAAGALVVAYVVLMVVFLWVGSRGVFMLLDNVLKGRAEVKRPWREFRAQAASLFWFSLGAFGVSLVVLLGVLGLGVGSYFWDRPSWEHPGTFVLHIGGLGMILVGFWVVFGVVVFFVRDFGVLWMYRHGGTIWQAAGEVWALAKREPKGFFYYLLARMGLAFVCAMAAGMLGYLTCCIGFLPYLHAVVTLPLAVFRLWYAVECFASLGPVCDIRPVPPIPGTPPVLGNV